MRTPPSTTWKTEIFIRLFLMAFFFYTDKARPFFRKIQKEEYWLYNFPRTDSYYPSLYLWLTIACVPFIVVGTVYYFKRNKIDAIQAILGAYLSIFLTGSITNCIKMGVGRPRPDFLERCFPDGKIQESMKCTGDLVDVIDGYKSFPSGHSSFMFSCLGYLSLYLAGQLHVFNAIGRGSAWRLLCVIFPLLWATLVAVSRTADYHHHWQDVTVGSILGMVLAYAVYRLYYPSLQRATSHIPYIQLAAHLDTQITTTDHPLTPTSPTYMPNIETLLKNV